MVLRSPIPDIVIPEISLSSYVLDALKQFGDKQAMINGNTGKSFTYSEIHDRIVSYASLFSKLGIGKSDVVAVIASNSPDYTCSVIATIACGAITTTCNPNYTKDEIEKQFLHSEPKLAVVDSKIFSLMKEVAKTVTSIKHIICLDGNDGNSLSTLAKTVSNSHFPKNVLVNCKEDVALLPYSSGTTGLPKGVALTHRNMVAMCEMSKIALRVSRIDTTYIIVPMFHIYGCLLSINGLVQGSRYVIVDRFQLDVMFEHIEKYKSWKYIPIGCHIALFNNRYVKQHLSSEVSFLPAVPPMLLAMDLATITKEYDLSSLGRIMCGAAPLPNGVEKSIMDNFNVRIVQAWGLSECVPITSVLDSVFPLTTTGVVLPNMQLKVIDPETGKELGQNQDGELLAKGPTAMKGYYKNPKATAAMFDSEGWLHTGDIGHYDELGYVYVVDRLKELIKYKGFQVAPAELESVLLRHPSVNDVAVIGIADVQAGEVPKAFVVTKDKTLSKLKIDLFLKDRVAKYKYLRGGVQFVESIPKSPSGKILRRELRRKEKAKSNL